MLRSGLVFLIVLLSYVSCDTPAAQYVPASQYGPPADSPPPPLPYAAAYPASEAVVGPYLQQYSNGPDGLNVQSGFEGYLVPSATGKLSLLPFKNLGAVGTGLGLLKLLHPLTKFGLKTVPKVALAVAALLALFAIGGLFTTAICTFTPFCTISFLGWHVTRDTMRSYITEDRMSQAAGFVMDAVNKYKSLYDNDPAAAQDTNELM